MKLTSLGGILLAAVVGVTSFATSAQAETTVTQTSSNQLNQLPVFETTPNNNAAGEGYASGQFTFLKYPGKVKNYRFEVQGEYGITDQITVGGWVPLIDSKIRSSSFGFGDVTLYGQYKFDQLISHDIVDVTGQLDVILPTGSISKHRDSGRFGVRPVLLAYKDFGQLGPGNIGAYASTGVTLTTNPDFRLDLAATYEWNKIYGILEFYDQAGDKMGRPLVELIPGAAYKGLGPLEVVLGFPFGLNDGSPDWGVTLKLTYAFQK